MKDSSGLESYKHMRKGFKVVVKTPLEIVKEFAISVQQYAKKTYYISNYSWHEGPCSPLYIAAGVGNSELCKYVAAHTEYENTESDDIWPDLHLAIKFGFQYESFKLIFENIQNKNPRNDWGETPLHHAVEEGRLEICNLIMENVAEKNPKDHQGKTPLLLKEVTLNYASL